MHTLPTEGIGYSWGMGGVPKAKNFKKMNEAKLEFPVEWVGGGGGVHRKNPFGGGGMDNLTFWEI